MPASIGLHDEASGQSALIDATWALPDQLAMLHAHAGHARWPDAIALTHAHMGHYTGLLWAGREAAATTNLPVHCSSAMAAFLRANGPWRQLVDEGNIALHEHDPHERFQLVSGIDAQALPVPHRGEWSDTMAFKLHANGTSMLYCPDIDAWGDHLDTLLDDVHIAFLDGTFFSEDELQRPDAALVPHPRMTHTMDRLESRLATTRIIFTHFNHTNPVLDAVFAREHVAARGFETAHDGLAVAFSVDH